MAREILGVEEMMPGTIFTWVRRYFHARAGESIQKERIYQITIWTWRQEAI